VGRFHEKFPISSRNPLTNKRIIGEVEFYRIVNPERGNASNRDIARKATLALKRLADLDHTPQKHSLLSNMETPSPFRPHSVKAIQAEFFGTDFNFLFSQQMRTSIYENCLEENTEQLMSFR
jgi:hypothetical protein